MMPLFWRTVGTTAVVWSALHLAMAFIGLPVQGFGAGAFVAAVCAAVAWLDSRRYSAHLFYANLGIPPLRSAAMALVAATALEVLLQLSLSAVTQA